MSTLSNLFAPDSASEAQVDPSTQSGDTMSDQPSSEAIPEDDPTVPDTAPPPPPVLPNDDQE